METNYCYIGREISSQFESREDIILCLSENDLDNDLEQLMTCIGIIILADTEEVHKSYRKYRQDNELPLGIGIAQQIRLKNINTPILFVAQLSRVEIYDNKQSRKIINSIGHDFLQLPATTELILDRIGEMSRLDPLELFDIQNSCCSKAAVVNELRHSIVSKSYVGNLDQFINTITEIASVYGEDPNDQVNAFLFKFEEITTENIERAIAEVDTYGKRMISLNEDNMFDPETDSKMRPWKLFMVDDQMEGQQELLEELSKNVEVIPFCNAALAMEALQKDWLEENKVSVLLADYRLENTQDGIKIQQAMQGYKLLSQVARKDKMIRLVALSALPKRTLLRSFRYFNVRAEVLSKGDYLKNKYTRKILCEELLTMGDENYEAILSLPDGASGWKYLAKAYRQYRNSPDYLAMETSLCEMATEYVDYFIKHGRFEKFVDAKKTTYKEDKDPRKNVIKVQDYFLARRLALWLGAVKEYDSNKIQEFLKGEGRSFNSQYTSQYLGLRIFDFPLGLTIEEKNWFHYDLAIPVYKNVELLNTLINSVAIQFHKLIAKNSAFSGYLEKKQNKITFEIGDHQIEVFFDQQYLPSLKTLLHAKALYRHMKDSELIAESEINGLATWINTVFNKQLIRDKDLPFSIKQMSKFFKGEVIQGRKRHRLTEADKNKIAVYVDLIKKGSQFKNFSRMADADLDMLTNVLFAYNGLKDMGIDEHAISASDVCEHVVVLIQGYKQEAISSRKLTGNNTYRDGKNRYDDMVNDSYR